MKKILGLVLIVWVFLACAGEVDLSVDSQIPSGKGWVVLTVDAPNPDEYAYIISYNAVGGVKNWHDFAYGKGALHDKKPDLQQKYGLQQRGRLVVLELNAGDYRVGSINIRKWLTDKSSDGDLGVRFKVTEGRANYLGHWNFEVTDVEGRAGTAIGYLLFLNDMGGFSASLKVSGQFQEIQKIFEQHAPKVVPFLQESLVKSAVVSRDFHSVAKYPSTGFAEVADVAAVPLASEGCRKNYENWLKQKPPRAFAVGVQKGCGFSWGNQPKNPEDSAVPAERVISACERVNGQCVLYAVDDRVVYKKPD
ncbi:MAG: hypothetical protein ACKOXU_13040 [Limnohabitans sp.]